MTGFPRCLLIANRGEIAIRIARTAAEMGIRTVAVYSEDDAASLHTRRADVAHALRGKGAAAYLDIGQVIAAAEEHGCDAIHPGYGFLSENADFARACAEAGIAFVGPRPVLLDLFGDKVSARALAERCGVPVAAGIAAPASVARMTEFLTSLGTGGAMMVKAVAGGGGRGMRVVRDVAEVEAAHARCSSEALSAFGNGDLYAERLVEAARHVEVQIVGDGTGAVSHLWERECTLQRRGQKLVEFAPSPSLAPALREAVLAAATRMAEAARYIGLGTFEFLVEGDGFVFIECNPRLQVEHTVTEAVLGLDLVRVQLRLAGGATLAELGLEQRDVPRPNGQAVQLRVNMETMAADGQVLPSGGTIRAYEMAAGPGIRVDGFGYAGYRTTGRFDSLLAKLVLHVPAGGYGAILAKAGRTLRECRVAGVETNLGFLSKLLACPDVISDNVHTRWVEENLPAILARPDDAGMFFAEDAAAAESVQAVMDAPAGTVALAAPMPGSIVSIDIAAGAVVRRGQPVAVIEAMKSELVVSAEVTGIVRGIPVAAGDVVQRGQPLLFVEVTDADDAGASTEEAEDLSVIRPDLAEVRARHNALRDEYRPDAVARRRKVGMRTARENVADLCDADSFVEYGGLTLAMQRTRRTTEELIRMSPADGFVTGIGSINGADFDDEKSRCMVLAYDYTVFAGTQGFMAHRKKDRMFELAAKLRTPVVLFSEGGGGGREIRTTPAHPRWNSAASGTSRICPAWCR